MSTQYLLFNDTRESVTSLLEREGISYEFSDDGVFSFDIEQRVEGRYFCRNDEGGVSDPGKTLLGKLGYEYGRVSYVITSYSLL